MTESEYVNEVVTETNGRWRVSPVTGWLEILTDEGVWVNPDCVYVCPYCLSCLGCIRKCMQFDCSKSYDGQHHLIEDVERN